jgi:hypothetical protein
VGGSARGALKKEAALYLAHRDPQTPWYGKVFATLVVTYVLSPIDLIPRPNPGAWLSGRSDPDSDRGDDSAAHDAESGHRRRASARSLRSG